MEIRRSENIGKLFEALSKAKSSFSELARDQVNLDYMTDYTALSTEIKATQDALSAQGIAIIQIPRTLSKPLKNGQHEAWVEISTFIGHSSGEFIAFDLLMPAAQMDRFDCQTIGSAITYGRRYSYESALCISGRKDDDGNAAAGIPPKGPQPTRPPDARQMKLAAGSENGKFAPPDSASKGYSV